jgi:hypothetical protein
MKLFFLNGFGYVVTLSSQESLARVERAGGFPVAGTLAYCLHRYAVDSLILLTQSIIASHALYEFKVGYSRALTVAVYTGYVNPKEQALRKQVRQLGRTRGLSSSRNISACPHPIYRLCAS